MTQPVALALSLLFELPVAGVAGMRWGAPQRRLLTVALAATLLTHPFAFHGFRLLRPWLPWGARAALVEGLVVVVEGALYASVGGLGWRRGMLLGLIANGVSFGLGLVINRW